MALRQSRLLSIIDGRESWRVEQRVREPIVEQFVPDWRKSRRIQCLFSGSVQRRILTEDAELSRRVVEQKAAVDCSTCKGAMSSGTRLGTPCGRFTSEAPWACVTGYGRRMCADVDMHAVATGSVDDQCFFQSCGHGLANGAHKIQCSSHYIAVLLGESHRRRDGAEQIVASKLYRGPGFVSHV